MPDNPVKVSIPDPREKIKSHGHAHRRLFRLAKDAPGFFPGIAIISLLTAATVILQMYLLSAIIADVFLESQTIRPQPFFFFVGCILFRSMLLWFRERFAQNNSVKIRSAIRRELFGQILMLGPAYTRTGNTGTLIASITDGVDRLDDYFTRTIPSLIHISILPPSVIIFALFADWISALILLVTGPLIIFFMWLIGTHAKKLTQNQWTEMSRLSSHFLDALLGLKTLKVFGMNRMEAESLDASSNRFRIITMKVLQVAFLSGMVLELAASISIAMVAVQVGIRLIEGLMAFQPGLFILLLAPEFYLPFRTLGLHHHAGMEGAAAAAGIFAIKDLSETTTKPDEGMKPAKGVPSIRFENVYYTYPGASEPVLKGIDCRVEPGALTAIVGHTGAGKTTFAHLLLGFMQPGRGTILVNDTSLENISPSHWHKHVAYVPQHPHFFNATILENLLMATPQADFDQVADAARKAGAHDFIQQLPQGYHTPLSENAARLSGGEKQRLAIARALLKDAPLLILDEPTSSLDPESEQLIATATKHLVKDRTTLIIAHRLNTVRNADNILVFNKGIIAESGKHADLMKKIGVYAGFMQTIGISNNDITWSEN